MLWNSSRTTSTSWSMPSMQFLELWQACHFYWARRARKHANLKSMQARKACEHAKHASMHAKRMSTPVRRLDLPALFYWKFQFFSFCIPSLIQHFGIPNTFCVMLQEILLSIFYSWRIPKPPLPKLTMSFQFSTWCSLSLYTTSQLFLNFSTFCNYECLTIYKCSTIYNWINVQLYTTCKLLLHFQLISAMFLDIVNQVCEFVNCEWN